MRSETNNRSTVLLAWSKLITDGFETYDDSSAGYIAAMCEALSGNTDLMRRSFEMLLISASWPRRS